MTVEVCAFSLQSCLTAQDAGADRIELCGSLSEGGTTPSIGLVSQARRHVSIALYVMIRPRGGDFLYSETEFAVMQADIEAAKAAGADGIVLGLLHPDGTIDEEKTRTLVEVARPLPVTFHRAFDMSRDPLEALEAIIRTGCVRILTSGQHPSATLGVPVLRHLVEQATGRIEIMAGVGVSIQNAQALIDAGVGALHLSGKSSQASSMQYRRPELSMASAVLGEYERIEASADAIAPVVKLVHYQK